MLYWFYDNFLFKQNILLLNHPRGKKWSENILKKKTRPKCGTYTEEKLVVKTL